ncbi:TRAF3-interacting protein 1-like isoform X4 [Gigantopelta aegis]|uniref:TRAF3-interacting protein 1-like isoform X4 n=1 Tax=Gigantopelta aegis TaxID=1735272 RepID=UPI001B88A0E3|nr:TRAF3-interacting protein 1-like isoform X4 [Gigantopelta aegis]
MDPKMIKKTQDTLGKAIKKPPLTDKLLSKPPFRFLHDVFTSVIKTTGFMKGLFSEKELNSENIKDRDSKIAFLQKGIDFVSMVTGKSLAVRPQKIVAGSEPEKTNEFLQALAEAIKLKVNNEEYVKKFNKVASEEGEEKTDPEKDREKKKHKPEERRDKDKEKHRSRDKDSSRERSRDEGKGDDHDREKDREKDKEKDRDERSKEKKSKRRGDSGKENQHPGEPTKEHEKQESPARIPRPTSAKGSRRRREGRIGSDEEGVEHLSEDEVFQQKPSRTSEPAVTEEDLPPQVVAARKLQRPPSARPAPPRPKQDGMESEPAMRLGTGKPANVIVDDGKQSDDDDDDNFIVEESVPPPIELDQQLSKQEDEDDTEHGALVKKMLETKKEFEEQPQGSVKKTEIERPSMSDAARRKQREVVKREIEKICASIQGLTRSANPLGKIMDYVQEDLDSMQKELERWRSENKEHALELKRESGITDRSIEPLRAQLSELEQAISDKLDLIAATKSKIIKNDSKIDKLLMSMSKS